MSKLWVGYKTRYRVSPTGRPPIRCPARTPKSPNRSPAHNCQCSTMDSFLDELKTEGDHDSDGVFTVDSRKAQMKLAEYQLANFEMFGNFLVEAAVSAGARSLDLTVRPSSKVRSGTLTTLYFRGWTLDVKDIEALDPQKSEKLKKRSLKHLSVALSTLSSKHRVTMRSRGESVETICVQIHHGLMKTTAEKDAGHPADTTTLRVSIDFARELTACFDLLRTWSPIPLSFNKALLPCGPQTHIDRHKVEGVLVGPGCPGSFTQLEVDCKRIHRVEGEPSESGSYLLILTTPEEAQKLGLSLLYDGSPYPVLQELSEMGVCGFLSAHGLKRDLSFTGLLNTEEYRERLQKFRELVGELVLRTMRGDHKFNQTAQLNFQVLLALLDDHLDLSAHWKALEEVSTRMEPTVDGSTFELQLDQIGRASQHELSRVLRDYQRTVETLRMKGKIDKARAYLTNKIRLTQRRGLQFDGDLLQKDLLSLACGDKLSPQTYEGTNCGEYLTALGSWREGKRPDFSEQFLTSTHPSWRYPFALHQGSFHKRWDAYSQLAPDEAPDWLQFLQAVCSGQGKKALTLLENTDSLGLSQEEAAWHTFLWFHLRGKVPFATAIQLRARLSASQARLRGWNFLNWSFKDTGHIFFPRNHFSADRFEDFRDESLQSTYTGKQFWPRFCTLLLVSSKLPEWQAVKLWTMVCGQSLLGALYRVEDGECPLKVPFLAEPLGQD